MKEVVIIYFKRECDVSTCNNNVSNIIRKINSNIYRKPGVYIKFMPSGYTFVDANADKLAESLVNSILKENKN